MAAFAKIGDAIGSFDAASWDACGATDNPFVSHAFLKLLEDSGSVGIDAGWQAAPIAIESGTGALVGAAPAYIKNHSQGEYVFDHGWAEAYTAAGGHYYPKLLIAAPFTPVPGPRLLTAEPDTAAGLIAAAEAIVDQNHLSSAHATFINARDKALFEDAGWLIRTGSQFHWHNHDYSDFDSFLDTLSSRKRKAIRKERASVLAEVDCISLTGDQILPEHWEAMWRFYQDTGSRKWGRPYLTRSAFDLMGERMADKILLFLAYRGTQPIAGALNFLSPDILYGRYWGATVHIPNLHFELCYYRAIDEAISRNMAVVEAGAQGEHKLARGYEPVATYSAHYIADPAFRAAVADFLVRESAAVEQEIGWLERHTPFKRES